MQSNATVELEIAGGKATLWLNRPAVRNALSRAMLADLGRCLERIEADETIRVLVLRGRGPGFCAGADLRELAELNAVEATAMQRDSSALLERLAALPVPSVAVLHGFAVGGGLLMSLYCDVRLASDDARIGFPPAARVWIPPWGLSRLARWVGVARAQQLVLTAGIFAASEGHRFGLIDHTVPPEEIDAAADRIAAEVADWPRRVVAEIRAFFAELSGRNHADWDAIAAAGFQRSFDEPPARDALRRFISPGNTHGDAQGQSSITDPPPASADQRP